MCIRDRIIIRRDSNLNFYAIRDSQYENKKEVLEMLRSVLFQKRGKIFACFFVALIVFLWLSISGINFAQSPSPGGNREDEEYSNYQPSSCFFSQIMVG